ncbi:methyltransferase family protein [Granulicella paludicola]|uniref:methyltransferase family protein n=1 Tax=Granulicella paludicola TaxID=474951 RepID=UPI0021DF7181|nr:isoprenylcysteine carboxylmethyltransferase family protein [Granulicella paludicola]
MLLSLLWKVLYGSWLLTEIYVAVITRTRSGGGKIDDRGSLYILWIVIGVSISLGSALGETYRPTMIHNAEWLRTPALALFAVGLYIRLSAIITLGRSFSANVAIHDTQKLNTSGFFRYMRHPSYTGMMLIFLAIALRRQNWLSIVILVVPPFLALLYRMHVEEAALTSAFGEQYIDYSRTTKRLLPGIY